MYNKIMIVYELISMFVVENPPFSVFRILQLLQLYNHISLCDILIILYGKTNYKKNKQNRISIYAHFE